jgi:hypothetical protein
MEELDMESKYEAGFQIVGGGGITEPSVLSLVVLLQVGA